MRMHRPAARCAATEPKGRWPWAGAILAALIALAAPAGAAPASKSAGGPALYFPTGVGDKWVHAVT
jgi:hypothetical protein